MTSEPDAPAIGVRVAELRALRGWSLTELGGRAHVSSSMLSEIERERANPTLAVAHRIATAFGLTIDELLAPSPSRSMRLILGSDPRQTYLRSDAVTIRTLSPLDFDRGLEFYEIRLRPGGVLASAPHPVGTREILSLHTGELVVTSGVEEQSLAAGDSLMYRADVEHSIRNEGPDEAIAYLIDRYGV
jgi:transcriptional regulator with XRE-family HTH domain